MKHAINLKCYMYFYVYLLTLKPLYCIFHSKVNIVIMRKRTTKHDVKDAELHVTVTSQSFCFPVNQGLQLELQQRKGRK